MKVARTEVIFEPKTNKPITITNDVVKLARPAKGMWGYIRWIDQSKKQLDLSELIEVDGMPIFPEGMEAIVMQCDPDLPVVAVRFSYEGADYREVFFYAKDLIYVAGYAGNHLDGTSARYQEHE